MPAPRPSRPCLAVSMGDPGGIGPEVIVKALADPVLRRRAHARIYGVESCLRTAADRAGIEPFWWRIDAHAAPTILDTTLVHDAVVVDLPSDSDSWPALATRAAGDLSFRFVESAIADAKRPVSDALHADAIVTAPISKHSWSLAGHGNVPGHTELLAARFGAKRSGMMFHAPARAPTPAFNVILATAHVALMDVRNVLTIGRVFDAIDLGHDACRAMGIRAPRIAVAGLNPHAGEAGLLGDEETRIIEPAIRAAADAGIDARGPLPGDTIFNALVSGSFDLVVAMYHDQGLIPVKLLARERAVNLTVGLPTVRTSPDHGTAFDIAGQNRADPGSMRSAIELAVALAAPRRV